MVTLQLSHTLRLTTHQKKKSVVLLSTRLTSSTKQILVTMHTLTAQVTRTTLRTCSLVQHKWTELSLLYLQQTAQCHKLVSTSCFHVTLVFQHLLYSLTKSTWLMTKNFLNSLKWKSVNFFLNTTSLATTSL